MKAWFVYPSEGDVDQQPLGVVFADKEKDAKALGVPMVQAWCTRCRNSGRKQPNRVFPKHVYAQELEPSQVAGNPCYGEVK